MEWTKSDKTMRIPIKSWCAEIEGGALEQAVNLARHPKTIGHVALMPDCHVGYGMPIGGVIACDNAVIPNAVGVDIGCGMVAVPTNWPVGKLPGRSGIRELFNTIKQRVPVGEGHAHGHPQTWSGFEAYLDSVSGKRPAWCTAHGWALDARNLGTLGGGNHFIELQRSDDGMVWLMIHSGSRNLGYRVAAHHHRLAQDLNERQRADLPSRDLAFLAADSEFGQDYIRDMQFALAYALENRKRMMVCFKEAISDILRGVEFLREVNIHHNFAACEEVGGRQLWVHRKGATSAKEGEQGIIPGSMGTASYIVEGLGNGESFQSCSHGAGRVMGRKEACRRLSVADCDKAMGDVVFDRWGRIRGRRGKHKGEKLWDLAEAPLAYKNIEKVIKAELDLVKPIVRLTPIGVVKG